VLALFLFGGEVLRGFSFALVVGILIGTYSSIAIAAPILVAYQEWRGEKGKTPIAMPLRSGNGGTQPKEKLRSKAGFFGVESSLPREAGFGRSAGGSKEDVAGV